MSRVGGKMKMTKQDLTCPPRQGFFSGFSFLFPYHPLYQYVLPCGPGPKFLHKQSSSVFVKYKESFFFSINMEKVQQDLIKRYSQPEGRRSLAGPSMSG